MQQPQAADYWQWTPAQPQPMKPIPDTRLCRNVGEWCLFLGSLVALFLVIAALSGSGVNALIGTCICLALTALLALV